MATLHIEHPISDYDTWREAFDHFEALRVDAGVTATRAWQPVDDDHYIVVQLDFPDHRLATAFENVLRTTIWTHDQASPALRGEPRTLVLDPTGQRGIATVSTQRPQPSQDAPARQHRATGPGSPSSVVDVPVLIVGAGPVGLSMAIGLRFHGVECLVVERHDSTLDFPKGRAVQARSMEIYRQWGVEERLRSIGLPPSEVTSAFLGETLLATSFRRLSFVEPGSAAVSPCERLICSQELLEAELRVIAEDMGADVRFGHELVTFTDGDDGVTATVRDLASGRELVVRPAFLVAADGARGVCREMLGIGLLGPGPVGNSVSIYVDAPLRDRIADRVSVLYGVSRPRPGSGFAVVDNDRRWLLMLPRDPVNEPDGAFTAEYCEALVRSAIGDDTIPVTYRGHRLWRPTAAWAPTMSAGHVFLAGDAAHVTTPAGGLGMNVGIADVHNLAWKLAAVIQGWAPPGLLATYADERAPIAQFTAEASMAIGAVQRDPNARRGSFGVVFGVCYRSAAITSDDTAPPVVEDPINDYVPSGCPGVRAPHVAMRDGVSVLDRFGRIPCVLIDSAHHDQQHIGAGHGPRPYDLVTMTGAAWRDVYGVDTDGIVVVRPDGHIASRQAHCHNPADVAENAVAASVADRHHTNGAPLG